MKKIMLEDMSGPDLRKADPQGTALMGHLAPPSTAWILATADYCYIPRGRLADLIGVSRAAVSDWINNERYPRPEYWERLARLVRAARFIKENDRKSFFAELSDKTPAQVEDALDEIERRAYFEGLRT